MASFGVDNKDNAMLEFLPANRAYQLVPTQGFRTFLKGKRGESVFAYEPFAAEGEGIEDSLRIDDNSLELTHSHKANGLTMTVTYYTLPHQAIPGLVREVTFTNDGDEKLELNGLDGLASMFPANVDDAGFKSISNTFKSWFDAHLVDETFAYYFLRGSTADDAKVDQSDQGNFYVTLLQSEAGASFVKPIFDRDVVFGNDLTLAQPKNFFGKDQLNESGQIGTNKVSCAFTPFDVTVGPKETITLTSVFGQVDKREDAQAFIDSKLSAESLQAYKASALTLAKEMTSRIETQTANKLFDGYIKQNYLDNGIRGGFPIVFENENAKQVFYLYSRKHGDLERDYNFFSISPEYFSQGNGNYRDMNQNRRLDIFFEPRLEDRTIRQFMSLIQLDGYNPLAIKTVKYTLQDPSIDLTAYGFSKDQQDTWVKGATEGFTPGSLKKFVMEEDIDLSVSFESFLTDVLSLSKEALEAEHGEGFWSDHWTYNLDLIDSYLAVYPDKADDAFFNDSYRFFNSPASVNPLKDKLTHAKAGIRQYDAVDENEDKLHRQKQGEDLWITAKDGQIIETNLFSKLLLLAANKISTLAPYGLGIEMEGGKPGWNDAMNGLPGMFGSGTSELYETRRLVNILKAVEVKESVTLPAEAIEFVMNLKETLNSVDALDLNAWKAITETREAYRREIKGVEGFDLVKLDKEAAANVTAAFDAVMTKAIDSLEQVDTELVPTYFYFEVELDGEEITAMKPHPVTPFLEGVVKKMKLSGDVTDARALYEQVKASDLYDQKLGMYKTSASIKDEPIELGRAKFFTPGWLENESVFLHMAYKYLLELVKVGLYDEFFEEIKTGLVVFTDPKVYGRSILENSSFIASSANPDESLHGKGFVARLSGSTVEFLNMWVELFIGKTPFRQEKELTFSLNPVLPADFFDNKKVSFTLFSDIKVTYTNETSRATFGENSVSPVGYTVTLKSGETESFGAAGVTGKWAEAVRSKQVASIDVELG